MLTIVAITVAAPGQEAALRTAQAARVAETVREPGCRFQASGAGNLIADFALHRMSLVANA